MTSSYPTSLDSFTNPTSSDNLSTSVGGRTHADMHADVNDAVENIEGELGVNPSGSDATVAARFTRIETAPTWTTVTSFSNGWIDAADAGYPPVSYCKDLSGFVHLRGQVKSGSGFVTAFTLPAGFRPQYKQGAAGRIEVQTNGTVVTLTTAQIDLSELTPFAAYS